MTNFNNQPWRPALTNTLDDQCEAISDNSWQNLKNINYLINHNMVSRVASASNNIRHFLTKSQKHHWLTDWMSDWLSNMDPRDASTSKHEDVMFQCDNYCVSCRSSWAEKFPGDVRQHRLQPRLLPPPARRQAQVRLKKSWSSFVLARSRWCIWLARDKAGNLAVEQDGTRMVESLVPTIYDSVASSQCGLVLKVQPDIYKTHHTAAFSHIPLLARKHF